MAQASKYDPPYSHLKVMPSFTSTGTAAAGGAGRVQVARLYVIANNMEQFHEDGLAHAEQLHEQRGRHGAAPQIKPRDVRVDDVDGRRPHDVDERYTSAPHAQHEGAHPEHSQPTSRTSTPRTQHRHAQRQAHHCGVGRPTPVPTWVCLLKGIAEGTYKTKHAEAAKLYYTTTVRLRGMGTGISEASKRVPIFSFATQGGKQVSSHFRQRNWVQAREAQIRFSAG